MTYLKLLPSVGTASTVTLSLFYLMQSMTAHDTVNTVEAEPDLRLDFVIEKIEDAAPAKRDLLVKEPTLPQPELIDPPTTPPFGPVEPSIIDGPSPKETSNHKEIDIEGVYSDGDSIPIVRVAPQYPARAAERGLEGWTVVEFTVAIDGSVENAEIIDAEPKGYFEKASLQAVSKFKYKPRIVDGVPYAKPGVRYRFDFQLKD